MPSWVGDAVMATPALRSIRDAMPGSFIGGLVRPGIDEVLAGTPFFDELHVERGAGMMGPKFVAAKLRPRRYETALILANSFSSALTARIAGVPRRIGYARDARSLLLTDRLGAPKRDDGRWAPVPAVGYYLRAAAALTGRESTVPARMELALTPEQEAASADVLARAGVGAEGAVAILNPGGNDPAKRWPPERFAAIADYLHERHAMTVLVNGSPAEADVVSAVASHARAPVVQLPGLGLTLGSLKGVVRRCRIMVTNDTGPRHYAAAFGVPVVSLFGPTDPRWTTIPAPGGEELVLADPTLPPSDVADDHPDRCRIDRIGVDRVLAAADRLLEARRSADRSS